VDLSKIDWSKPLPKEIQDKVLSGEILPEIDVKQCFRCGEFKKLDRFDNMSRYPDGKHCWCKDCRSVYNHDFYIKKTRLRNKLPPPS